METQQIYVFSGMKIAVYLKQKFHDLYLLATFDQFHFPFAKSQLTVSSGYHAMFSHKAGLGVAPLCDSPFSRTMDWSLGLE